MATAKKNTKKVTPKAVVSVATHNKVKDQLYYTRLVSDMAKVNLTGVREARDPNKTAYEELLSKHDSAKSLLESLKASYEYRDVKQKKIMKAQEEDLKSLTADIKKALSFTNMLLNNSDIY
tara:strand:- start:711 stop:1073 length:363 start_codon:yes stop_codon:yes gene_type:complete